MQPTTKSDAAKLKQQVKLFEKKPRGIKKNRNLTLVPVVVE